MKITDIKQQVKRAGRVSIYIDDEYSFSLSDTSLLDSDVRIGREVTPEQLGEYRALSGADKAFDRALNFLAIRPRSIWELRSYLQRKECEPELVDTIVNKLSDRGYLDDEKFAQSWVDNRHLLKSISKRKLALELKIKRIDQIIIDKVLAADETDELQNLKKLIEKKKHLSQYRDPQKLTRYLVSQGYNYSDIKSALSELDTIL